MHRIPLNNLALIKINGADATNFLQGQLTNDVSLLNDNWHYSGYCSPKGRLLGLFALWRDNDTFYALLNASLVASVLPRLKMFVLRSKVVIEHLSSARAIGIIDGGDSLALDDGKSIPISEQTKGSLSSQSGLYVLGMGNRSLIIDPTGSALEMHADEDGNDQWLASNIAAGLPSLQAETAEMFVPQMLNLDLVDGISFKKGCYTGQEIVARMHYLGKLKQRMFVCDVQYGKGSEAPGTKIVTDEGKNAGNLVTPIVNGQCLAVLRLEHVENQLALEDAASAVTLQIAAEQPYPISRD